MRSYAQAALLLLTPGLWAAEKPPVILISVDTLRADHLSCYGSRKRATPNIDSLAKGGTLFARADSPAPLTLPAHTAMFTSTYPFENGVRDNGQVVGKERVTLAEVLKKQGYRTGAFVGGFVLDKRFGLDRGFDHYDSPFEAPQDRESDSADLKRLGQEVVGSALKWIGTGSGQPFFAFIHLFDLHTPENLPAVVRQRFPGPRYEAELGYVDEQIGRLVGELKRRGIFERAVVVFTADHGEGLGDHGEKSHGFLLYQSTIAVPLVMHWPVGWGAYPARVEEPVSLVSLGSTVLDLVGAPRPATFRVRSLVSALQGRKGGGADQFSETVYPREHFAASAIWSLRAGNWKYIHSPKPELYDLSADPGELKNLYGSRRADADELKKRLETVVPMGEAKPVAQPNAEVLARLKSLGYVGGGSSGVPRRALPDPKDRIADYELYRTAVTLSGSQRWAEANPLLEKVLASDGGLMDARMLLGLNQQRLGQHARAVENLQQCVAAAPGNPAAHFHLARSLVDLKRTREALKELEAALVAGRDGQWRHIAIPAEELLARLQIEEKDFAGAANHYQHLLSVDSRNYEANYNLAWLAARENRLPDGVRYLEAAVKARPKDAAARNALGGLYLRLGRLDEAAGELLKAAELDPKSHWAPFNLGLVYRQKRDLDAAAAQFRRALELQPGFEGAARMLREMGR